MHSFRYKAFISYSHTDEAWAKWLHRTLESYKVPKKLVGTSTAAGEVPARVRPVFRDRDELSSAADLSTTVTEALSQSENLIVICSPGSAASRWVKEEIREFTRLGRTDRIFCIIVDGEADESGSIASVFPGAIAEAGLQEPLAADARKWADGKQLARLKLLAGMLGLPLDQLRRRELQKRRKIWSLAAAASVALVVIIFIAVTARMAAEQRRDSGETLVALKLNELRTMLTGAGEPEELSRLQAWDDKELAELIKSAEAGNQDLLATALEMRDEGVVVWDNDDLTTAMEIFKASWALNATAYSLERSNQDVFFELGQAEYWIGEIHLDMGDLERAEASFLLYAEITRRLIQAQPQNALWVLEMAFAMTNLGRVQIAREGISPERTLQFMQSALEYNQIALVLDPGNEDYRAELGQSHAFLADAQRGVCDLEGALKSRQEQVEIESSLIETAGDTPERREDLAFALTGYANILALRGFNDESRENHLKALQLIEASAQGQPRARSTRLLAERKNLVIWMDAMSDRVDQAWEGSNALWTDWQYLSSEAGLDSLYTLINYSIYLLDRAWLANARGDPALANELLEVGLSVLATEAERLPDNRDIGNTLTLAAYRFWEINNKLPPEEILSLLPDYRAYNGRTRACVDASMAVKLAVMSGEPLTAADLAEYLLKRGYRETGFMQVCEKYYSCSGMQ